MPPGHLPVRSYLAVPVKGVAGEVLGGLFFGHSQAGVFTEQHERLAVGMAAWASVALENARLYADAQEANRMKDEFLAVLSHELRTPLNAIVGYARLLRGGILPADKAARGLETLERNATWLTQIVEDVLDVSRIVSGKIRLDVQPVELPLIVDNAVATVQPAADAKGVRLQTIIDPRVGPVSGDPDRLQQVVWNLLSNAVKFTPKNGRVQVRLERVNSHVEIVVSDTGIGIRAGLPAARLRAVPPGRRRHDAEDRRPRPRPGHRPPHRRDARRHRRGGERRRGPGRDVPRAAAADDRASRARCRRAGSIRAPSVARPLTGLGDLSGIRVLAVDDEEDALDVAARRARDRGRRGDDARLAVERARRASRRSSPTSWSSTSACRRWTASS